MTQLEIARRGNISPQMEKVAGIEGLDAELVRERIAKGTIVIPANIRHFNYSLALILQAPSSNYLGTFGTLYSNRGDSNRAATGIRTRAEMSFGKFYLLSKQSRRNSRGSEYPSKQMNSVMGSN